ncbi:Complexin-1, partial [Eschrichtius robustus]|nr:Complexin-1 [Eschrichtius robustus]
ATKDMGKMLGGDEEKDPDAAKREEERQEALRQEEAERKAKCARMEAEREAMRQGIRDKKVRVDFAGMAARELPTPRTSPAAVLS